MEKVQTLGYLTLGVPDLTTAVDFYTRTTRLRVSGLTEEVAFLTGGREHHWLRLERAPRPQARRVSYRCPSRDAFEAVRAEIEARDIPYLEGGDMAAERVGPWLRFSDPSGIPIELYLTMAELAVPATADGIEAQTLLHTLWKVSDFDASLAFHQEVLGFRPSDFVEDAVAFLRCGDRRHHSLALLRGGDGTTALEHLCLLVGSLDDVMRLRHNAVSLGLELEADLLRHPTSGSIGIYVRDPLHGGSIEFCTDHQVIEDPDHRPRVVAFGPAAIDIWKQPLDAVSTPPVDFRAAAPASAPPPPSPPTDGAGGSDA